MTHCLYVLTHIVPDCGCLVETAHLVTDASRHSQPHHQHLLQSAQNTFCHSDSNDTAVMAASDCTADQLHAVFS